MRRIINHKKRDKHVHKKKGSPRDRQFPQPGQR